MQKSLIVPEALVRFVAVDIVVGLVAFVGAVPGRWMTSMSEAIDDAWDLTDPLLSDDLPVSPAVVATRL